MRIASICGDIILTPPELEEGLLIPSSKATPACVAIPPRLELLNLNEIVSVSLVHLEILTPQECKERYFEPFGVNDPSFCFFNPLIRKSEQSYLSVHG